MQNTKKYPELFSNKSEFYSKSQTVKFQNQITNRSLESIVKKQTSAGAQQKAEDNLTKEY